MTDPVILRWESPPASHARRIGKKCGSSRYDGLLEQLREKPGEWAVILDGDAIPPAKSLVNTLCAYRNRDEQRKREFDIARDGGTVHVRVRDL